MRNSFWFRLLLSAAISPLIGACVFSYPPRRLPTVFRLGLEYPLPGAVLPLGDIPIYGYVDPAGENPIFDAEGRHVGDQPAGDATGLVFYANGVTIGEIVGHGEARSERGSEGEIIWRPAAPGEYLLQVKSEMTRGPDSMSVPVRVCVVDFDIEAGAGGLVTEYWGPCIPPTTRTVALSDPGAVTMEAHAEPRALLYQGMGVTPPCPAASDSVIAFEAVVVDPRDEVAAVVVLYSITGQPGSLRAGSTDTWRLLLVHTASGLEPRTKSFEGHTEDSILSGYPTLGELLGQAGALEVIWSARALGRRGQIIVEEGPFSIPAISSCGPSVPLSSPLPTATATLEPSEENCPPGTYYAPVTNQCIAIEIKSPRPGNRCSDYSTLNSCTAAGCSWDGQSQTCK